MPRCAERARNPGQRSAPLHSLPGIPGASRALQMRGLQAVQRNTFWLSAPVRFLCKSKHSLLVQLAAPPRVASKFRHHAKLLVAFFRVQRRLRPACSRRFARCFRVISGQGMIWGRSGVWAAGLENALAAEAMGASDFQIDLRAPSASRSILFTSRCFVPSSAKVRAQKTWIGLWTLS